MFRAGADGGIDDFLAEGGMVDGPFVEGAEGPVGDGVEKGGGDFGGGFGGFEEIDVGDFRRPGGGEVLLRPEAEVRSQYLARVGARGSVWESSQRQAGGAAQAAAISAPMARSSA
ncbi:MAG: hypothetical protein NTV52_19080 [Acidobacteria bacterium]|nr:hypothetical protein [Acidobacteriota bacterium]